MTASGMVLKECLHMFGLQSICSCSKVQLLDIAEECAADYADNILCGQRNFVCMHDMYEESLL